MESIVLHDIDDQLSTLLKQQAAQAQKSIDQFILDTLKKHFGLEKKILDKSTGVKTKTDRYGSPPRGPKQV